MGAARTEGRGRGGTDGDGCDGARSVVTRVRPPAGGGAAGGSWPGGTRVGLAVGCGAPGVAFKGLSAVITYPQTSWRPLGSV